MKIAVASDHGGFALKELVKKHLEERGAEVLDLGTHSEESVDYPIYGKRCAEAVASGEADLGVVCCGIGIGISIAANKVKGIRCGLCTSVEMAHLTKQHNNANMIALGGRTTAPELALIDGNQTRGIDFPCRSVVGGDGKCADIAAASILAKVSRDRVMREMDRLYPGYGFAVHKGYGTKQHYAAIRELGATPIHRMSFLRKMH